jgi:DNA-binding HxlR family transcriptional regulator
MAHVDADKLTGTALTMTDQPPRPRPCSIAAALQVIGERWTLLAVRELGYGVHRFDQIAAYTGATRDILAGRLRKLEAQGVVERRQYSEHPPRYEYHLTQAGEDLFPILRSLGEWGDTWAVDRPAVRFRHSCGHELHVDHVCHECGEPVTRTSVELVANRR